MFSFFRRKKKQETPAQEETRIQETAAEAVERAETTVSQTIETVQENIGEKAEELTAAVETAVESAKERAEEIRETVVEHVSETVEHVREAISETSSETVEQVEERVEAVSETVAENVSAAVEHVHEAVSEGSSETVEAVETVEIQAEAAPATSEEHSVQTPENTAVATSSETSEPSETEPKLSWAARLKQGLTKSRDKMAKSLAGVFGGGQIDEDLYEELETVLITSDMGMEATEYLMKDVRNRVSLKGLKDGNELRGALKEAVYDLIKPLEKPLVLPETKEPFVIMLAGINGAGKTTSIGKLAKYFQAQGKSVLLAAGDTFRAAAREQLQAWGERNNVTVISQTTGDSAAVCFDAVQAAKARGIDIVLADTAGRLPTQLHLMEEIKKVKRVLQKAMPDAPHEIIVVLDANIGQNAVNQVKAFDEALGLTGLIVTKLDGTAKGGILAALASDRPVPVRYIGVGEGIDDLRPFNARAFVDALLD
ncbi:signal recognition particle-docking protein FtsY [Neisseria sp. HMSC059F02]|uniref:signal recognition particle-docking protein FtsY n=1 Tax=Neisseria TaxID=482 RepID=UPI0008AE8202|nr:signal recognition particle-docking protein FtsY [Neisseria mucosa]MBS5835810.1 signal recognition particle-docking protein FtsY [Neisseria sp.]OFM98978.1 signal recognition particle-docking protein FtsY [Neisseria sp. HMSC055F11]OFN31042.1 signal recognition particle-docking protein FtsY [Neisseria sp. HMSC059F02]OHR39731.1 signal recognition particle-docking protein FtsY [Neisseria sp. HMSC070E12]